MPIHARRLWTGLAALFALVLVAVPAVAQERTGGIELTVTDAACERVGDAPVIATDAEGGKARATTNADGEALVDDLAAGEAQVTVRATDPTFDAATAMVDVTAGETTTARVELPYAERTVTRVAGDSRVATAVAASQRAFPDGAEAVVIASSGAFPDALAAAPLAGKLGGPLLLVDARSAPGVLAEVERLEPDEVVIVGAIAGVTAVVQSELLAAGEDVRRIAGEDRFDTAALIAREVGLGPSGAVALATGAQFADALAFAPIAAADGIPVLLTGSDALPEDTAAALAELGPERTFVLGGTAAIGESVAQAVPSPRRVAGATRFATSVAIARLGLERGADLAEVGVATGLSFPDALAAGPAVGAGGGVLLLVDGQDAREGPSDEVYAFLAEEIDAVEDVVVYGGTGAVTEVVESRLARPGAPLDGARCSQDGAANPTTAATAERSRRG